MAVLVLVLPLDALQAVGVFAALTIASTYLGRRFIPQLAGEDNRDINDATGRLIGHHGRTVGAFTGRAGRVFIDGKEWAATTELGSEPSGRSGRRSHQRGRRPPEGQGGLSHAGG